MSDSTNQEQESTNQDFNNDVKAACMHNAFVAELPLEYETAGVILYSQEGFWLTLDGGLFADIGGMPHESDVNAWETAIRYCKEVSGLDLSDRLIPRAPVINTARAAVIFFVESGDGPVMGCEQFTCLPRTRLHPRLLYDKNSKLRLELESLGFGPRHSWLRSLGGLYVHKAEVVQ